MLIESLDYHWRERTNFFLGGNMFISFSSQQVRDRDYRGPDFFVVCDAEGTRLRKSWIVWEEQGRYPDVIVELLSPSTAEEDKTVKKTLYERAFRTPEYFCYDPDTQELLGWHLRDGRYQPITPDAQGRLWSSQLQLSLGHWQGTYLGGQTVWLRFFNADGNLVLTKGEGEEERAAAAAAAEIARLRAQLEGRDGKSSGMEQ